MKSSIKYLSDASLEMVCGGKQGPIQTRKNTSVVGNALKILSGSGGVINLNTRKGPVVKPAFS